MESKLFMRRIAALMLFGLILGTVFTFSSCSDDDEGSDDPETLAGVYVIQKGVLTDDIKDVEGNIVVPSGTDITAIMIGGIFGASPCDNMANSAVDMRVGGKLFFVCTGTESAVPGVDAGSWEENITLTTLTLTLNSTVVPPIGFSLPITGITKSGAVLSGSIESVPLTKALLDAAFPGNEFAPVVMVGVDMEFLLVPELL